MSKPITIRVSKAERYSPFHDTTEGKLYKAELYDAGETSSDGTYCSEPGVEFIDDVGDYALAARSAREGVNFEIVG